MATSCPLLAEKPCTDDALLSRHSFEVAEALEEAECSKQDHTSTKRHSHRKGAIAVCWMISVFLSGYLGSNWPQSRNAYQQTYSPVQSEIEYVLKTFEQDIVFAPIEFQNPDTVDEAWLSLYDFGMATPISEHDANRLPNETLGRYQRGAQDYMIQLDVFHELHCLDLMRYALEPHYGLKNDMRLRFHGSDKPHQQHTEQKHNHLIQVQLLQDPGLAVLHLNHCLNALRQSLMCSSDVAVNVFLPDGESVLHGTVHTCRNFDKIREWAIQQQPG